MELKDNPYLQREDYMAEYNESIENLKNHPEFIEFDKLCYETFNTEYGKKFMEHVKERFIIPSMADKKSASYQLHVIWADGFKDFPRMILNHIRSHEQRIKAGSKA